MDEAYTKRLSASHTTIIELKPASVWTLITTAGILEKCHPFCESNTAVVWDENEHIDVLVYLNGRRYVRTFHTWTVNEGFSLLIGSEGGAQSYVEWNIEAHGDEHSRLTITVFPYILAKLPRPLALLPHLMWVRPRLRTYLRSVLSGFQYHLATEQAVPRNHFGSHPWFS